MPVAAADLDDANAGSGRQGGRALDLEPVRVRAVGHRAAPVGLDDPDGLIVVDSPHPKKSARRLPTTTRAQTSE
jgi:hypothetical protein